MPELRGGKLCGNCRAELKMGNVSEERQRFGFLRLDHVPPCTYVVCIIATIAPCVTYGVRGMVGVYLRPLPHE